MRKKMRSEQGVRCRKNLHSRSDLFPAWLQTSTLVLCPAARLPDGGPRPCSRLWPPFLGSRLPPDCSRCSAWLCLLGRAPGSSNPGPSQGAGQRLPPGPPDPRRCGEGWGIPGDPGRGGGPGPGVGHRSFQFVPLFKIGAGGALRSRDGASPIGAGPCLRVPGSNAAAPWGSAARMSPGG